MTALVTDVWADRAADASLPLWLRVAAYAEAHARPHGHCPLTPQQLHNGLDPTLTKQAISRAIAKAISVGWLHPASSARCLVLTRATAHQLCPATHRDTTRS